MGKLKLKIATVVTGHPSAGKIETKDRRGREGGMAIFSELKIQILSSQSISGFARFRYFQ